MKKKYIVNGKVYEIPDEESAAFLKDFPDAKVSYNVQGKEYEIPHQESDAFETDMGLKKKTQHLQKFLPMAQILIRLIKYLTRQVSLKKQPEPYPTRYKNRK